MLVKNKHGVEGCWTPIGSMWRSIDKEGKEHPAGNMFVPSCCFDCDYFEDSELGDMGTVLTGPCCIKNVWFPIKKGTCKAHS